MIGPRNRRPTELDHEAFLIAFVVRADVIDPDQEKDWNSIALGFLIARNVDPTILDWECLSSFTCGDVARFRRWYVDHLNGKH